MSLRGIFLKQYRWYEENDDDLFMICSALNIVHVVKIPSDNFGVDTLATLKKNLHGTGISLYEKKGRVTSITKIFEFRI